MPNPFVHVELQTKDLARAKDFYTRLFGWKLKDEPMPGGEGSYTMIDVGGGIGGGMFTDPEGKAPTQWLSYVGVEDVKAATAKARELGATIRVDAMEIGNYGWMSVFTDPTGATLAMWQPKPQQN